MRKVGEALRQLLKGYNLDETVEDSVFSNWKKVCGDEVAGHSRVKDVRNGTLYVEVDHPGWIQIMQFKKKKILSSVQKSYPLLTITDVRFYLNAGS
ncbi:MAG: DUF721 domain-containing protein [Spirochaetales bacterium]|nr:MAG: DUF721 domain-containing protein [Spirochaetales bacterium]